jgi:hypothetical protein
MNFKDIDDEEPILIREWAGIPALKRMNWGVRELATMIRCKMIIGDITAAREYLVSPANMRKALAIYQRNTGSDKTISFL